MTVNKKTFFEQISVAEINQRGASILEVLLVMSIVAILTPFLYGQIADTSREINDIATAKKIIALRDPSLNFVRINQDKWPDVAQIKLDEEELGQISDLPHAAFIDKYLVKGAVITDVYLAFKSDDALRAAQIAKHIGSPAATVGPDGVAYGASWAVAAPDFAPGDLIYRINYNFTDEDTTRYLHRGSAGEDNFNEMQRNLNMGRNDFFNIGNAAAQSGQIDESLAAFLTVKDAAASTVFFTSGANMDGSVAKIGSMRVTGDITGFRNINATTLNRSGFSTNGTIVADRARVNNSINVGTVLNIKSDSARTISGFAAIMAHTVATPFISADEMTFYNNFGLTVSGELLMSTTAPMRIGSWIFPSTTPPRFADFTLTRAPMPQAISSKEFEKMIKSGWRDLRPVQ